jgi:NhaA family Na+:H+ antiporter
MSDSSPDRSPQGRRAPAFINRLTQPFQRFVELEAASSILLLVMTIFALAWANSPFHEAYLHVLHLPISFGFGSLSLSLPFEEWVNDALMTIFFFVVGMEIKRELVHGELSTRARALFPVVAAFGGMVVPAGIYAWFHFGGPASRGWGIPMATDIAFAIAALMAFGSRVPPGLKVFLLALAIADDLAAVAVIAVFYTADLSLAWFGGALLGLALVYGLNRAGVRSYGVYLAAGALVWLAMLHSGVHATVAGVMLGFLTPSRPEGPGEETLVSRSTRALERLLHLRAEGDHGGHERHRALRELQEIRHATLSPLDHLTNLLHPWVAFLVMPIFAFSNAGVALSTETFNDPLAQKVAIAVALGLLLGKPLGITFFSYAAVKARIAVLPAGVSWPAVMATGVLAGIGFTVALFVTALAFEDPLPTAGSKIGILSGSAVATVLGVLILSRTLPPREGPPSD